MVMLVRLLSKATKVFRNGRSWHTKCVHKSALFSLPAECRGLTFHCWFSGLINHGKGKDYQGLLSWQWSKCNEKYSWNGESQEELWFPFFEFLHTCMMSHHICCQLATLALLIWSVYGLLMQKLCSWFETCVRHWLLIFARIAPPSNFKSANHQYFVCRRWSWRWTTESRTESVPGAIPSR